MSRKNELWPKIQMIQNIIFGILSLKYYFEHTNGHDQIFFLISYFLAESPKANKN